MFPVQQCFLMPYFSILALFGGTVFELQVPQCIFSCTSWAVCSSALLTSYSPSTETNTSSSKSALQGVKAPVQCPSWAEPVWVSICNVRLLPKLTRLRCLHLVLPLQTSCVALSALSFELAQTESNHACEWHSINFPSFSAPLGSSESPWWLQHQQNLGFEWVRDFHVWMQAFLRHLSVLKSLCRF